MSENIKWIENAILKKDGCLYCPECNARIQNRGFSSNIGNAIEKHIVIYGKCKCKGEISKEWSFTYLINQV